MNVKKLVLTNLPYVLIGLVCTNLGEAWRMASGSDASEKILSLFGTLPAAFGNPMPSMNALDLLVGLACGLLLRLAVYLRGKNAKKYRHGYEYGAARWGTAEDIRPYVDPVFKNNIILTQTERLTMNSRPKDPKTARNKWLVRLLVGCRMLYRCNGRLVPYADKRFRGLFAVKERRTMVTPLGKQVLHDFIGMLTSDEKAAV